MSFRERSAWAMGLLTLVVGVWYLASLMSVPQGEELGTRLGTMIPYVLSMVAGSIIIQTVLAVRSPVEAQATADERERPLIDRAGNWSGVVMAGVVATGALEIAFQGDGNRLFAWVMGGLIVGQVVDYGAQLVLFRRGH